MAVTVKASDFQFFVLCSLRYCLDSMSLSRVEFQALTKKHVSFLTTETLNLMLRDVEGALFKAESFKRKLGMLADHKSWEEFAEWLDSEIADRNPSEVTDLSQNRG